MSKRAAPRPSSTTLVIAGAVTVAALGLVFLVVTRDDDVAGERPAARQASSEAVKAPATAKAQPAQPAPARRSGPDPAEVYAVPVAGDPFRGDAAALVTIVSGGEYACPFCDRVRPTLDRLLRDYPGSVRVVHKDYVVHKNTATEPAKTACAAHRQGRFWEMDEALWEKAYRVRRYDAAHLEDLARDVGLDMRQYRDDLADCGREVSEDAATLHRFGVRGTPAFFINGRFLSGAQPYERFQALVDEELAKARARVAQGTPASQYYTQWVVARGLDAYTPSSPMAEAPDPSTP